MPSPKVKSDPRCKTCHAEPVYRDAVNDMLIRGMAPFAIERAMRAEPFNWPIKYESIKKHLDRCAGGDRYNLTAVFKGSSPPPPAPKPSVVPAAAEKPRQRKRTPEMEEDFALLVHERALEEMEAGSLRVSTKDGLAARALLDRREEKKQDRLLMLGLARLLSGAGGAGPVLTDGEVLDGEGLYKDVTPVSLLAPDNVREAVG